MVVHGGSSTWWALRVWCKANNPDLPTPNGAFCAPLWHLRRAHLERVKQLLVLCQGQALEQVPQQPPLLVLAPVAVAVQVVLVKQFAWGEGLRGQSGHPVVLSRQCVLAGEEGGSSVPRVRACFGMRPALYT